MKIIGLIAEFNPFHNGHKYLIEQIRHTHQADIIVCVMSGHFLQRGEPAIINKWQRAKVAVLNDVDIVIDLPYIASVQPADIFALRAIEILNQFKITHLAFGCEVTDIIELNHQVEAIAQSQDKIYQHMQQGLSYAQATLRALPHLSLQPNHILALAYLKAINKINTHIQPIVIKRTASHYHDTLPQHQHIASATAIRQLIKQQQPYQNYIPSNSHSIISTQLKHDINDYWLILKTLLVHQTPDSLANIYDMREGLAYRFIKFWQQAHSYEHFIQLMATKRYSIPRIQRCCCHLLTQTTQQIGTADMAKYYQILAFTTVGQHYLKKLKSTVAMPLFTTHINQKNAHHFAHDIRVSQLYSLTEDKPLNDLTQCVFIKR